jgi:prolyl oligopeptidase
MTRHPLITCAAAVVACLTAACAALEKDDDRPMLEPVASYPDAPKADVRETLHGVVVEDPFRPLEDPDAPPVRRWIDEQNALTRSRLDLAPAREALRARLTELWNYERYGLPFRRGTRWFYSRNDGLQNQSVLYVADRPEGPGEVLLDPNALSKDGTVALTGTSFTEDGGLMAYGVAHSGSDWQEWRVRDVATKRDLSDVVKWVKFSDARFTKDGRGFFYSRYDAPKEGEALEAVNSFQKLCFHVLGEPQEKDVVVYEDKTRPGRGFSASVTEDGRRLVVSIWEGTSPQNGFAILPLPSMKTPIVERLAFDAKYDFVGSFDDVFFFVTDLGAPRGKLVALNLADGAAAELQTVVPESDAVLSDAALTGGKLFLSYLRDARSETKVYAKDGTFERDVPLSGLGTASGFRGRSDDRETFFSLTTYSDPGAIHRYDVATGETRPLRKPSLRFDPSAFVTEQIFATSKDGTRVPMFVSYKRGLKRDGSAPTYLYGYGGFNVALTPSFSPAHVVWMERGGVYVEANLRGGSEYGETWHEAGTKLRKQNVFDDFYACAETLRAQKFTRSDRLAIGGHSNGGLLVGAAITQRPELFGAAICGVGVLDMLRFHKFTIGWAWTPDYGSPEDPKEFAALLAYSPYHNTVLGRRYPATLITTADHDDRVVPAHSFKFAAALQKAQNKDGPPILIRIDVKAGHGAGKPVAKQIDEWTDVWSFLLAALGEG